MSDIARATDDLSIPPFLDRTSNIGTADAATAETVSKPQSSWRDHLRIHPAAELFPLMSEPELRELGEDIKKNGLRAPIIVRRADSGLELLDGRNRLDAMEMVGNEFDFEIKLRVCAVHEIKIVSDDPYEYVISANLHRRHLTADQKRDLIAKVLKAKPGQSNRQIAKQVKAHHTTVGTVRAEMESTGEISQLEKTVGADGKSRPKTKKAKKPRYMTAGEEWKSRATGSQEVDVEQHRAQMAALDEPAEVDEVDKRINCVTNTILRHIEGLSRADAERFIAALRDRLAEIAVEATLPDAATSEAAE